MFFAPRIAFYPQYARVVAQTLDCGFAVRGELLSHNLEELHSLGYLLTCDPYRIGRSLARHDIGKCHPGVTERDDHTDLTWKPRMLSRCG